MSRFLRAYNGLPYMLLLTLFCFGVARCAHADDAVVLCKEFKPGEFSCIIAGTVSDVTPPSDTL